MYDERHIIRLNKPQPKSLDLTVRAPREETPRPPVVPPKPPRPFRMKLFLAGIVSMFVIGVFFFARMHGSYKAPQASLPQSARASASMSEAEILTKVAKLMVLPQGEKPTVALVSDLKPLKDQIFFKNAKLGDALLMYARAKRAVLYRPSENKIIEVAPITTGQ